MKYRWYFFLCCLLASVAILFWPEFEGYKSASAKEHTARRPRQPGGNGDYIDIVNHKTTQWLGSVEESKTLHKEGVDANLQILDENGEVKEEALTGRNLNQVQVESIKKYIQSARAAMAKGLKSRLQVDPKNNNPELGVYAYHISADKLYGDSIIKTLRDQLKNTCGDEQGELVFQNLRPFAQFGCFGRQDLFLTMNRNDQADIGYDITLVGRDPTTGVLVAKGLISTPSSLKFCLGDVFDLQIE